ncbi:hypothetical protein ACFWBN_23280 [Streptomyces sp. NPDC059989]|uniref:hypothetical protein n=1 Tax=Streptomyces sp. NPDC059989 TaxID=3347026 RepID=UPI003698E59B
MEGFSALSDSELIMLCAATAERAAPFCRILGTEEQRAWLESGLELAWRMAAGEDAADDCSAMLDWLEVEDDEEEFEDADPTAHPGFYADQAVGLVGESLASSLMPSGDRVETALKTVRTLFSMVDFKLSGEKPVIVRSGEERPPPGPLVQRELDAAGAALGLLSRRSGGAGQQPDALSALVELRNSAREFAAAVTPSLEEFAEANDWK